MIEITRLAQASDTDTEQINGLLQQLRSDPASHTPINTEFLNTVLSENDIVVLTVRDSGTIIGTGSITWNQILTDRFALIEDVVIDSAYRGQGLGEKLMRALIDVAKEHKVETIALTSRPTRIAANHLYPKLGFKKKETNFYEMDL